MPYESPATLGREPCLASSSVLGSETDSLNYPRWLTLGGWRWLRLLVPIALLRVSVLIWGVANVDETTFFVFARMLREGALPYVDVVDNKPILAYLAFAPGGVTGWHLWPLHLLAMAWIFGTAVLLARAVELWTGDRAAGWTAAWLCTLATCCAIPAISTELQFNLPVAGALLCAVRAGRGRLRWDFAAGAWVALASLFKHQSGIALVAIALGIALEGRLSWPRRIARGLVLGLGFAGPWALVGGFYVAAGHWAEFFEWNITRNIAYSAHDPTSPLRLLAEGLAVAVVLAAPVAWVLASRAVPRAWRDPFGRAAVLLLGLTWVAVSMGGRFYLHYFLQFVPPLAVLAAPEATVLLRGWGGLRPRLRTALAFGMALPIVFWAAYGPVRGLMGGFPSQDRKAIEIADWVRANSRPEERLFLWGSYSPVYYLAERVPGTRYIDAAVLGGNFDSSHIPEGFNLRPYQSARDIRITLADLERNRPALVVDTAPADLHDWRHFPLSDFPALNSYVHEHYAVVGHPAGAVAYRRQVEPTPVAGTH
jgi:hypothetical protein